MSLSFNILIVEDDDDMLWCLREFLNHPHHNLIEAQSGEETFHQMEKSAIDLAVVDAKLPDVDGMELAAEIKKKDRRIPVIFISGYYYKDDNTIKEAIRHGAIDAFIPKPFGIDEVVTEVEKIKQSIVNRVRAGGSGSG